MILDVTWRSVLERLQQIAEGRPEDSDASRQDEILRELGLVLDDGLTAAGDQLYMALYVLQDSASAREALAEVLVRQPIVYALLEALWPVRTAPVSGAVSLLKRLTRDQDDQRARRWLGALNEGGLVAYNRASPKLRILVNPAELQPEGEAQVRERERAHILSRQTPYGNLLVLRELLRAARDWIRWWEQHMPAKVLEVLYRELDGEKVSSVRLLSGPANVTQELQDDYRRFRREMKQVRGIDIEWRVVSRRDAFAHHDRFFLTDGMSRNLPPLNTILAGSTGEILPSKLTAVEFDQWWSGGTELQQLQVDDEA